MADTYRFGLFGHPVKHSLSPVMHAASFRSLGIAQCREEGFNGLNLTIPHKEAAVHLMTRLDASARLFGAVNTVAPGTFGWVGFNTDASGFLADLKLSRGVTPDGLRVLILGCGGAGRALAIACAREGAAEIGLANRTASKASALAEEIGDRFPDSDVRVDVLSGDTEAWSRYCHESDLVVQCTSTGLCATDASLLPCTAFRSGQLVYDIVYTSRVTPTMRAAQEAGADVLNGAGMLVQQGAAAFAVWTGLQADTAAMRAALEAKLYAAQPHENG
jgi:shikimate dehydrogenase